MRQLHEHKPSTHSFITGNMVRLSKRARPRNAAPGPYKIFAQLPERDGQLQYRVKSGYEPFYRTVMENELESDVEATVTNGHQRSPLLWKSSWSLRRSNGHQRSPAVAPSSARPALPSWASVYRIAP